MNCKHCDSVLDPCVNICPGCGMEYVECLNCGTYNEPESLNCEGCNNPVSLKVKRDTKRVNILSFVKKRPYVLVVLLAVIFTVALLVYRSTNKEANILIYNKDGMVYVTNFNNKIALDREIKDPKFTKKGDKLFYISESEQALKCKDLSSDQKAEVISTYVIDYHISNNGNIVHYVKGSSNNNVLYRWQSNKSERIAEDVSYLEASKDGKRISFISNDQWYVYKGNKRILKEGRSASRSLNKDLKEIYFKKDDKIYLCKSEKVNVIVDNVSTIIRIYESGEIYYLNAEERLCFYDKRKVLMLDLDFYNYVAVNNDFPFLIAYDTNGQNYVITKGKAKPVDIFAGENIRKIKINSSGTKIYYIQNYDVIKRTGDLMVYDINTAKSKLYDQEVIDFDLLSGIDKCVYYKNSKEDVAVDLYVDKKLVDSNAYIYNIYADYEGNIIYQKYENNLAISHMYPSLHLYNGKKLICIGKDVVNYYYYSDKAISYTSRSNLCFYNGKKTELIDTEVSFLILPNLNGLKYTCSNGNIYQLFDVVQVQN